MAVANYIRDLSGYLVPSTFPDLTLNFGEKSWQIHKALACSHSIWFRKATTIGFEGMHSGVITLNDDPVFANAIDAMVVYFYKACYEASNYDTPAPLLHAQVAIIADKYDCASLYKIAIESIAKTVMAIENKEWIAVASLIYEHTTSESLAHVVLRRLIVAAVAGRPSTLREDGVEEFLRSNADLATDLLLSVPCRPNVMFTCSGCHYAHTGSLFCPNSSSGDSCLRCVVTNEQLSRRYTYKVGCVPAFPCPFCDGIHTDSTQSWDSS